MTDKPHLLPTNATDFEKAFSRSTDVEPRVGSSITAIRGFKYENTPSKFLPFLVYEYGLGQLTPYVPNLFEVIDEGIDWQRVRGTHKAIELALAWLDYTASVEVAPVRRRRWHLFQLGLDRHRDELEDLDRIEGVTSLSVPVRSHFWRGFSYYDVRAFEGDYSIGDDAMWDDLSGIRIREDGTKWSFGRPQDIAHTLTEAELTPLGLWSPPLSVSNTWESVDSTWETEGLTWDTASPTQRSVAIFAGLISMANYVQFKDADDNVIGYRRIKSAGMLRQSSSGDISYNGQKYMRTEAAPDLLYIEALTDFDQATGSTATKASLICDAYPSDLGKPGLAWVEAGEMAGDQNAVALDSAIDIEFAKTIREDTRFFLTI